MEGVPAFAVGLMGLAIGAVVGFAVRRARLCTFAAIEDATLSGDTRRLRVFALALVIAILGTQSLVASGLFDPRTTAYLPAALPWVTLSTGGILFGLGMSLVGTCAFGSLVRLGGGDLRSLVVLMVFGLVAAATLQGALAGVRADLIDGLAMPLPRLRQGDLPAMIELTPLGDLRWAVALSLCVLLLGLATRSRRLSRERRLVAAGTVLGLGIVAAWIATVVLPDPFVTDIRPQGLTFVAPVGRAIYGELLGTASLFDFGVASVLGVVLGSAAAAWSANEFRWDAFDDQREMRRHLLGATLMGAGGVLAGGCTIGQGLTAGALLALSAPIAVGGMVLGARIGIHFLIEGGTARALLGVVRAGSRPDP